jgi:hypothetical protein
VANVPQDFQQGNDFNETPYESPEETGQTEVCLPERKFSAFIRASSRQKAKQGLSPHCRIASSPWQ